MADFGESDEDFKLPLRTWLERQINARRFGGLEWLPSEGESKMFKLPWVKKNSPNWEEYYEVFRAWAKHRGRREQDDSRLKSNFRCALNKSVDFKEVTSKSQMYKQTGNFKVYRILSPKEVREMKKKSSPVQAKRHLNIEDSHDLKSIDKKGLDILDSMDSSPSMIGSCGTVSDDGQQPVSGLPSEATFMPSYAPSDSEIGVTHLPVHPPLDDARYASLCISPAQQVPQPTWPRDSPTADEPMDADTCEKPDEEPESMSSRSIIMQQLENAGFSRARVCDCQLVVVYNGEKVIDRNLYEMNKGYRVFYGDQNEQIRFMQMRNATDEKLADFMPPGINLPEPKKTSHTMSAILSKTDLGVILCFDFNTLQLYVKRLCQSQVFYFDPHDPSAEATPLKLERNEPVCVFSLEKYFTDYLQQVVDTQDMSPPEADICLSIGIKPKSKISARSMKGLKVQLIPHALKFLMQNMKDHANSMSLCFSNPTSIEYLLRQIQQSSSLIGTNRLIPC